jgi:hypothetical protein
MVGPIFVPKRNRSIVASSPKRKLQVDWLRLGKLGLVQFIPMSGPRQTKRRKEELAQKEG